MEAKKKHDLGLTIMILKSRDLPKYRLSNIINGFFIGNVLSAVKIMQNTVLVKSIGVRGGVTGASANVPGVHLEIISLLKILAKK